MKNGQYTRFEMFIYNLTTEPERILVGRKIDRHLNCQGVPSLHTRDDYERYIWKGLSKEEWDNCNDLATVFVLNHLQIGTTESNPEGYLKCYWTLVHTAIRQYHIRRWKIILFIARILNFFLGPPQ